MDWKTQKSLRQWIRDYNAAAAAYGHEDAAGTPDDPDPDYVEKFDMGMSVAQVLEEDFGSNDLTSGD